MDWWSILCVGYLTLALLVVALHLYGGYLHLTAWRDDVRHDRAVAAWHRRYCDRGGGNA